MKNEFQIQLDPHFNFGHIHFQSLSFQRSEQLQVQGEGAGAEAVALLQQLHALLPGRLAGRQLRGPL